MHPIYASYFQKLNEYIRWQTDRIRSLERRVDELAGELDKVKSQERIRIDKIEYNFDQLKVETLEGTLNVGIAPSGINPSNIEDMAVDGKTLHTNTAQSESFERIQKQVNEYLSEIVPVELTELESQYGLELGEDLRDFMIGDLQGQTGQRIEYYMQSVTGGNKAALLTPQQEADIIGKVSADIRAGVEQHLQKKKT